MNYFTVIEIIDANTIRVMPKWMFLDANGKEFSDNKLKILGSNVNPDNAYIKHLLSSLVLNREVELVNPVLLSSVKGGNLPEIACNVIVDKTDLNYYLPETAKQQYA